MSHCLHIAILAGVVLVARHGLAEEATVKKSVDAPPAAVAVKPVEAEPALPTDPEELAKLEGKLNVRMQKLSMATFEVLKDLRTTRQRLAAQDEEIKELQQQLADLYVKIEDRMMEKYKQLSDLDKKREALMTEHEKTRQKVEAIKKRRQELDAAQKTESKAGDK